MASIIFYFCGMNYMMVCVRVYVRITLTLIVCISIVV